MKFPRSLLPISIVLLSAACRQQAGIASDMGGGGTHIQACQTNADCKSASAPICTNHYCGPKPTAGTNGVGEACTADTDCLQGLVCDHGKCDVTGAPAGTACKENDDCQAGLLCIGGICDTPDGGGVGCNDNGDCMPGQVCVNGQCTDATDDMGVNVSTSCNDNTDCPAGQVCTAGQCTAGNTPCNVDADCAAGETCQNGQCAPAPSGGPVDMASPGPMSCTVDADCPVGQTCQNGQCASSGGPVDMAGPVSVDGGTCTSGGPGQLGDPCLLDSDCACLLICSRNGYCRQGCVLRPANCYNGYICNTMTNRCQKP
jgi:Cys-rich repeat protein